MSHAVHIIAEAEEDIFDIYNYIALHDSPHKADSVFQRLRAVCESLDANPDRGHYPPELERIDIRSFREVHFKPYRIIYQILDKEVFVHCVLDGRRDLQELLQRRLVR